MSTNEAVMSEKTVCHPTDAMCWDELPSQACAMEFRPPSALELSCTWQRGMAELTKVSCLVGAGYWLLSAVLLPHLASTWHRFGLIGLMLGLLVAMLGKVMAPSGLARTGQSKPPLPINFPTLMAAIAIAGVLLCPATRWTGALAFGVAGFWLLGMLALQMVRHQVGWHSANPHIPPAQRQQWRAGAQQIWRAWKSDSTDFQNLALEGICGCLVVGVALVVPPACYFFGEFLGAPTWSWWVPLMTVLLLVVSEKIWVRHSASQHIFQVATGHWLDYQRDMPSSPLVYQSPAGSAAQRTLLLWATVAVLVTSLSAMISNANYLAGLDHEHALEATDFAIVSLMDTALAAVTVPWLVGLGVKIISAPALVAAYLLNELPPPETADSPLPTEEPKS